MRGSFPSLARKVNFHFYTLQCDDEKVENFPFAAFFMHLFYFFVKKEEMA